MQSINVDVIIVSIEEADIYDVTKSHKYLIQETFYKDYSL